ncbi:phytoene desaturase family protein [Nocardioides jishulii]|nr:NAD(P)/FAD-dependent oxidoreductase [Nocardioides jishulii]
MTLSADLRIGDPVAAPHWDAIVIGAGLGGLSTAAFLAREGQRVLVLEQHEVVGGSSQSFRRGDDEFDVGLHRVGECEPGGRTRTLLAALGVDQHVEWLPVGPDASTITLPDLTVRVPVGWDAYEQRLAETFPAEADGVRRCVTVLRDVAADLRVPRPGGAWAKLTGPRSTRKWAGRSLTDLFDSCGLGASARAVVAAEGGSYAAPPSATPVSVHAGFLDHFLTSGAWYPRGGGQVLPERLAQAVRDHGGEVHTGVQVDRVMVEHGRAIGVTLVDGEELRADAVVSNADPRRTWLALVGREHLPKRLLQQAEAMEPALPFFTLHLVLDLDLRGTWDGSTRWVHPETDVEGVYAELRAGRLPRRVPVMMTSRTLKDPEGARPGRSVLELVSPAPREHHAWGLRAGGPAAGERYSTNPDYLAAKQHMVDAVLATAETVIPGLRDHVLHCEASTPVTHERHTLASGGSALGLAVTGGQVGDRRPDVTSPVRGLFLTGSGTRHLPGVVNTLRGGAATAGAVLGRDLLAEIAQGSVARK